MNKKMILLYLSILLYFIFLTPFIGWDIKVEAFVALVIIQILWIGRVFPLAFSSVLLILILSFNFFTFEETMSYFGSGIIWLLFSTFIMASAFIKTGLASRISLKMLRMSQGSGKQLIFLSFLLMFVLSLFIPSNIGKGSLVASVLDSLVKSLKKIVSVPNLSKSLFIGVAFIVSISGAFVATGASSTIYAFGMFGEITSQVTFVSWILYFGPPIVLFLVLLWVLFLLYFPPESVNKTLILSLIDEQINELGKITIPEIKVLVIIGMTLLLWMTESFHGFSIPLIAMLGASFTVLPFSGVWDWEEAKKSIDWDMILFFAATLMVSKMLIETGTVVWIADELVSTFDSFSPYVVLIFLVISTALVRIIFVNVLGFLTIIIPVAITVGQNISAIDPLIMAMAVFLAGVPGFLLITQSPVHLISYSYGYFTEKDLFRVGLISMVLWVAVVFCSVFFYWSWIV
ncbi:SLC13 family permease [Mesobacillus jeotgali]|uniref:SLC13 family permease n=1 Tax=Mesobacillus jeotgali TaxID=129985 RepID=UPI001CE35346|nr:SLC13 family permease [Mesobacillus jeotgali]UYZ21725.1 SLC13 family permease [Mesobacillus jeotgali]